MLGFPAFWRWLPNACSGSLVVFWVLSLLIVLLQSYTHSVCIVAYVRLWRICFVVCFSLTPNLQVSCVVFQNPTDMPLEPCTKYLPEYPYSLVSPFILSKDMVCPPICRAQSPAAFLAALWAFAKVICSIFFSIWAI